MAHALALALALVTAPACQKAQPQRSSGNPISDAPEVTLESLRAEILALSQDLSCSADKDCAVLEFGNNRCRERPGPSEYLVFSRLKANEDALRELAVAYTTLFLEQNPDPIEPCSRVALLPTPICLPETKQCGTQEDPDPGIPPEPVSF